MTEQEHREVLAIVAAASRLVVAGYSVGYAVESASLIMARVKEEYVANHPPTPRGT